MKGSFWGEQAGEQPWPPRDGMVLRLQLVFVHTGEGYFAVVSPWPLARLKSANIFPKFCKRVKYIHIYAIKFEVLCY